MRIHYKNEGKYLTDKHGRELCEGDRVKVDFNNLVGTIVFGAIENGHPTAPGRGYSGFYIEWDKETPAPLKRTRNDIAWWAPGQIEIVQTEG